MESFSDPASAGSSHFGARANRPAHTMYELDHEEVGAQFGSDSNHVPPSDDSISRMLRSAPDQPRHIVARPKAISLSQYQLSNANFTRTCPICHEGSFHEETGLQEHMDTNHNDTVMCRDPATVGIHSDLTPLIPLYSCDLCQAREEYTGYSEAASHLRRCHFFPSPGQASCPLSGSGPWPPMEKLRDWFATIETRNVEPASNKDATVSRNRSNSMSSASSFKGMNMATGSGRTQSKFSASSGDSVCVKSDAGPVNSKPLPGQENDLLLLSVSKGDNDAVRKLFGLDGVNLICKDQFHRTPLHVAVDSGHKDTAKLLLDEGAPMMWADENGRTALHLAADSGHIAIVQLLLDNKANSQATDTNGRTPLHLAIDNGNRGVALLLLEAGADAMCADKHGRTPLHLAADGGDLNNVHLLLDIGADVASLDDHGQTALHLAVEGGNKDVAQLLLESGADITLADSDGRTPLHLAACGQDAGVGASVIQLLLENGAISNLPDNFGQTPYQLAQKFGNVDSFCRWDERWKVAGPSTSSSSLVSERATEDSTSGTNNGSQHLSNSSPPMVPDSPSTCSTTGSLTSTEEQAISMIQSDENIQHLIKVLSEWFKRAIDLKLGVKVVAGADSSSTASEQLCDTSIQQSSSRRSLGRKRLYRQRPGEEDQGGGDGNGEPETKHRRISGPEKQKIACPYLKYDHAEFVAWQTCPGPGFDAIHRLKEHLRRRHFKEHSCQRCGLQFESNKLLQEHLRAVQSCSLRSISNEQGFMSQLQFDDIMGKRQGNHQTTEEKWKEIYRILFPDIAENLIPSPYFDVSGANGRLHNLIDPAEYTLYLRQNLPGRVLQQLNREFEIISAKAKERLVEIAQAETLETLKSYISQKSSSPQAVQNLATWPVSDGDIFDLDSSPFFETDFVMDQLWATGKERTS